MFTHKDIESRTIFLVNCVDNRKLRVMNGELLLEDTTKNKAITKLPFQKILALFIIGHTTITTPLIDKCGQYGIPVVVMKSNFRPVFFYSITAEANYLLREKQYAYAQENLKIPKIIVSNKIENQIDLLKKTRIKQEYMLLAIDNLNELLNIIAKVDDYNSVMGIEGRAAKHFFVAYFNVLGYSKRSPRTKIDPLNTTMDIGYTLLFNFIEAYSRLFGFDPYCGVYHRLWFKRKSLICDLVEPFRCIIDKTIRKNFNLQHFKESDFTLRKGEYILKYEESKKYTKTFFEALVEYKGDIFKWMQGYYRAFMQDKAADLFPKFKLK